MPLPIPLLPPVTMTDSPLSDADMTLVLLPQPHWRIESSTELEARERDATRPDSLFAPPAARPGARRHEDVTPARQITGKVVARRAKV